jgi:hypothetical protein
VGAQTFHLHVFPSEKLFVPWMYKAAGAPASLFSTVDCPNLNIHNALMLSSIYLFWGI